MSIEAMKQALGALETKGEHHERVYAAITALRQAIEQAEKQKPVPVGMTCKVWTHGCALFDGIDLPNETLLYTAPPPRKEWIGLTDEEIAQTVGSPIDEVYLADFHRVIEKLRSKNT